MRAVLRVMSAAAVLAYPVAIYFGLPRFGARVLALVLASLLLAGLPLRLAGKAREHVISLVRVPLTVTGLLLLGAVLDDRRFVLALPVLTNLALLAHFAASLRTVPIAERFARAQEDDLTAAQVAYCRAVTVTWCGFFVANGAMTTALALWAPLGWWTAYTGVISYVLVGLLGTSEYVTRKVRFRKYGSNFVDRLLERAFPAPGEAP
jgi:uncharacterized membrane protein